jgi:hypothetical protein
VITFLLELEFCSRHRSYYTRGLYHQVSAYSCLMTSGIGSRSSPIVLVDDGLFDDTNLGTKSLPIVLSSDDDEDEVAVEAALSIVESPSRQRVQEKRNEPAVAKPSRKSTGVAWDIMYNMGYQRGHGLGTRMRGQVFLRFVNPC